VLAEFAKYVGCKYAVTFNTATSALEVLCPARMIAAGTPVYMDMTAEYFVPDFDTLKFTMNKYDVQGVMWVHIGGIIAPDFPQIVEHCRSKGLFLIEDAAHAHGSWLNRKSAGTFGDGGAFSFFPTKVMTTMEGGMLTTDSKEDADIAKSLRNQGKRHAAYGGLHYDLGNSWRITEIAAYIGLVQLAKLDRMVAVRQRAVDAVTERLNRLGVAHCDTSHMSKASQCKFIIRLPEERHPELVKKDLATRGIMCGGGVYEVPCHQQPVFAGIPPDHGELRVTEKWCPRHICPRITSGTTPADAERIAAALSEVLG
jgi:perosamine synthetase